VACDQSKHNSIFLARQAELQRLEPPVAGTLQGSHAEGAFPARRHAALQRGLPAPALALPPVLLCRAALGEEDPRREALEERKVVALTNLETQALALLVHLMHRTLNLLYKSSNWFNPSCL